MKGRLHYLKQNKAYKKHTQANKPTNLPHQSYLDTYIVTQEKKSHFELNMEARIATTKEKEHSVESDTAQPANNSKQ